MKRNAKNILLGIVLFFVFLIVFLEVGESVWGVDEENVLLAPDWYTLLLIFGSVAVAIFVPRLKDIISNQRKKKAQKKEYDSLSDEEMRHLNQVRFAANLGTNNGFLEEAKKFVKERQFVSVSDLQRKFYLRYAEAAALMDKLEECGIVDPFSGGLNRNVLVQEKTTHGLEKVDLMEGHDFEYWCAELLRKNDFVDVEVTQGSGDHGVDVLAVKDGVSYAVQCKCYSHDLGNTPVQEIYAGKEMYGCQVAAVMTNRHFTAGGKALAEKTRVLLWDRDTLIDMLNK